MKNKKSIHNKTVKSVNNSTLISTIKSYKPSGTNKIGICTNITNLNISFIQEFDGGSRELAEVYIFFTPKTKRIKRIFKRKLLRCRHVGNYCYEYDYKYYNTPKLKELVGTCINFEDTLLKDNQKLIKKGNK
jgi:hypothetical protein